MSKLTQEQIHAFFNDGFFILENVFNQKEIDEISSACDRLYQKAIQFSETTLHEGAQFVVEGKQVKRVVWAGATEKGLLKFGTDPRLLEPVSELLGSKEMNQLICQIHYKMPGDKVSFDWHQDSQNRGYGTSDWKDLNGKGSYVQTLIAVDEMTLENGPLLFIPGSCKRGHLSLDQCDDLSKIFDENQAVPLTLKPGSVAFFGPYSIHGSKSNDSNKSRRVFINGYSYPGANHKQYPGKGSGRRVRSQS